MSLKKSIDSLLKVSCMYNYKCEIFWLNNFRGLLISTQYLKYQDNSDAYIQSECMNLNIKSYYL